jgi:hypothetical protein
MNLFLHDLGYNFFEIPSLTYAEINNLLNSFNRREKKKANEMKKNRRKK